MTTNGMNRISQTAEQPEESKSRTVDTELPKSAEIFSKTISAARTALRVVLIAAVVLGPSIHMTACAHEKEGNNSPQTTGSGESGSSNEKKEARLAEEQASTVVAALKRLFPDAPKSYKSDESVANEFNKPPAINSKYVQIVWAKLKLAGWSEATIRWHLKKLAYEGKIDKSWNLETIQTKPGAENPFSDPLDITNPISPVSPLNTINPLNPINLPGGTF